MSRRMNRSRAIKTLIILAVVTGGALALRGGRTSQEANVSAFPGTEDKGEGADAVAESKGETTKIGASTPAKEETRAVQEHPSNKSETGGEAKSSTTEKLGFKFERELAGYAGLKKKVFASEEVLQEKARLFENADLLRGLEPLLRIPASSDSELQALQNDAIDLLLEARAVTKGEVPAEILRSLIEDPQIEGQKLDLKSREALAGVKAEVMYQWTSQEPEAARDVANWLPGPVSTKIWQNVLAAQEQNRLESLKEVGH